MRWSAKAADLRRDPRHVLHSTMTGPDSGEGELKLHGCAVAAGPGIRADVADAWWSAQPLDTAIVFVLRVGQALFVAWDLERGVMTVHRWSPRGGCSQTTRTYPWRGRRSRQRPVIGIGRYPAVSARFRSRADRPDLYDDSRHPVTACRRPDRAVQRVSLPDDRSPTVILLADGRSEPP